jgi:hypothetical protein
MCVFGFQKIANHICKLKDINPDKPRNLAKTVTVWSLFKNIIIIIFINYYRCLIIKNILKLIY